MFEIHKQYKYKNVSSKGEKYGIIFSLGNSCQDQSKLPCLLMHFKHVFRCFYLEGSQNDEHSRIFQTVMLMFNLIICESSLGANF